MLKRALAWLKRVRVRAYVLPEVAFAPPDINETNARKAELARDMLDNPLYREVMAKLERKTTRQWAESAPSDSNGRELLYMYMWALNDINNGFRAFVSEAQIDSYNRKVKEEYEGATSESTAREA